MGKNSLFISNTYTALQSAILVFMGLASSPAFANQAPLQDVYKYQIEGGFPLKESCTVGGEKALSLIKVYVQPEQVAATNLVDAYVKVRVCTIMGKQVKQALPLVLPIQTMEANMQSPVGTVSAHPFSSSAILQYFDNGSAPDTAILKRISGSDRSLIWFELSLVQSKTGKMKAGPIRIGLTEARRLKAIRGFNTEVHLPIRKLEIDVPENNITLRAELRRIDQERN